MKSLVMAATVSTAILSADPATELQEIDRQIEERVKHLKEVELHEMRSEMQAQNSFYDWSKFSGSMEIAEADEREANKLLEEIKLLEKKREELQKALESKGKSVDEKRS